MTQHEDAQRWFESVRDELSNPYTTEAWIQNQKQQHDAVEQAMAALMKDKKKKLDVKSKEMAAYKLNHDYLQKTQEMLEGYLAQQQQTRAVTVEEAQRAADVELDRIQDYYKSKAAPGFDTFYDHTDQITGFHSTGIPFSDLEWRREHADKMFLNYNERYQKGETTDEVKAAMAYWSKIQRELRDEKAFMVKEYETVYPPPPPPPAPGAEGIYDKLEYPDWTYLTIAAAGILAIALFL